MEKLQAALEKARNTRDAGGVKTTGVVKDVAPHPDTQDLDARWAALSSFQVNNTNLKERRVVTRTAGPEAAPFDVLRTKILLQMRQRGWKRLAITSPLPNTGKTTTACNLALGLGRQKDMRAILMDLDLRDPSVHEFFQVKPPHGISDLLSGQVDFAQQALRINDNVACCMATAADNDPARLLLADETAEIIDQIEATYQPDLLIFDLPSVLVNDETRAFLKNAECALIVARSNTTRYNQFDTCEREIAEQTNVLGVVLNAYNSGGSTF